MEAELDSKEVKSWTAGFRRHYVKLGELSGSIAAETFASTTFTL
jgi:hypothetical protein